MSLTAPTRWVPIPAHPAQVWRAPDIELAKRLVRESGTFGAHVTLVVPDHAYAIAMGAYLQSMLHRIGYEASLRALDFNVQYTYIQNSNNKVQISMSDQQADYPAASDFLEIFFSCGAFHPGSDSSLNFSGYCKQGPRRAHEGGRRRLRDRPRARQRDVGGDRPRGDETCRCRRHCSRTARSISSPSDWATTPSPRWSTCCSRRSGCGERAPCVAPAVAQSLGRGGGPVPARPHRDGGPGGAGARDPQLCGGSRLCEPDRAYRPVHLQHRRHGLDRRPGRRRDAARQQPAAARHDADRAHLAAGGRPARRRQPGPRRAGTPAVRRPRVAADRHLGDAALRVGGRRGGDRRRVLRRDRGRGAVAA